MDICRVLEDRTAIRRSSDEIQGASLCLLLGIRTIVCQFVPRLQPPCRDVCDVPTVLAVEEQIHLMGSSYKDVLLAEIGADNLPPEYGGTSDVHYLPGNTMSEEELRTRMGFESFSLAAGVSGVTRTLECAGDGSGVMWNWCVNRSPHHPFP